MELQTVCGVLTISVALAAAGAFWLSIKRKCELFDDERFFWRVLAVLLLIVALIFSWVWYQETTRSPLEPPTKLFD